MKYLLLLFPLLCMTAMFADNTSRKIPVPESETPFEAEIDSPMVNVIAYFCKHDTVTYWINESRWKVANGDTTKTASISTKVMITVTDSTETGYNMEYRFLEIASDTLGDSALDKFQYRIAEKLKQRIIGTTIKFHTDEMGAITGYDNLKEIKKQAKSLFKEASKELLKLPEIKILKENGLDFETALKRFDTDELVNGYVEELELLFQCHGKAFDVGERSEHEDATQEQYASDTNFSVIEDTETGDYQISIDVYSYIPAEDVKTLIKSLFSGQLIDNDSILGKEMENGINSQITEQAIINTYLHFNYSYDGWPLEVVSQDNTTIGGQGKLKQTYIVWDYRSTGN